MRPLTIAREREIERRDWERRERYLKEDLAKLQGQLDAALGVARSVLHKREDSLRDACEGFLSNPSREAHRELAGACAEYRKAWTGAVAEETRRTGETRAKLLTGLLSEGHGLEQAAELVGNSV